jgi:flagellar motility protein MotE (MotC chaperone)
MFKSIFVALAALAVAMLAPCAAPAADPLPKFTEEREAAAIHFVRKHCPELLPLLEDLKKANRAAYELQIRETFQVTELLADLQEDPKRYELELKVWKAENKALVLVAKLATVKDEDRKVVEDQLLMLAKELVELDVQTVEHRVEVLRVELTTAKDELAKLRENFDRQVKERFDALMEKTKKKKP